MRIESLRKYNGRNPHGYFSHLPPKARLAAWRWLGKFRKRWPEYASLEVCHPRWTGEAAGPDVY
jgi:hypothetical protein